MVTVSISCGRNGACHIHQYCPAAGWLWTCLCKAGIEMLLLCAYWDCAVTSFEPKHCVLVTPALCSTKKTGDTCFESRESFPRTDPCLFILLKPAKTLWAGWARVLTFPQNGRIWSNLEEGKACPPFLHQALWVTFNSHFRSVPQVPTSKEVMAATCLSHMSQKYPEGLDQHQQCLWMGKLPVSGFWWPLCQIQ